MRDALLHDIANDSSNLWLESNVGYVTHAHVRSARHAALLKKSYFR